MMLANSPCGLRAELELRRCGERSGRSNPIVTVALAVDCVAEPVIGAHSQASDFSIYSSIFETGRLCHSALEPFWSRAQPAVERTVAVPPLPCEPCLSGTNPVHHRSGSMTKKPKDPKSKSEPKPDIPPPGPHARPELIDPEKTPGAGTLPEPHDPNPGPTG